MANALLMPDPDDQNPLGLGTNRHPIDEVCSSECGPVTVVGQDSAARELRGVMSRYLGTHGQQTSRPTIRGNTAIVGPIGCGKTITLEYVAGDYGLRVAHLDLAEAERSDIRLVAASAIRKEWGDGPFPQSGIVLVENLMCASAESRHALGGVLAEPGSQGYAKAGTKVDIDLGAFLWVTELSGIAVPSSTELLAPYELPVNLVQSLDFIVPFRPLTKPDLFTVLSVAEASPLNRIREELANQGVAIELSELALWEMVEQAITSYPNAGVRGLHRVVADLELRLWSSVANSQGETNE